MALVEQENSQLGEFFDWLYGVETGYVYVALKATDGEWKQDWFEWPTRRSELIVHVQDSRAAREVYYGPALYNTDSAKKPDVKGARVFWCEFDGEVPTELNGLPAPTLRILSSEDGHEHWYWKIDSLVSSDVLERVNRSLTYMFGADSSGWDSTQVLRPPGTFNHKRQREVTVREWHHDVVLASGLFQGLPEPPPPVATPLPESIPPIEQVIMRYKFTDSAGKLFRGGVPVGNRSSGLMALGYHCAEMGMTNEEVLAILMNADERWGKFKNRSDRMVRLLEIVTIARQKYPYRGTSSQTEPPRLAAMGLLTLLRTEVKLEWAWNGLLQKAGYLLLTGPSGVGKTQMVLDLAFHMGLGQNYLDREILGNMKIGFFSLEMGLVDLKYFLMTMVDRYTAEEQAILEETFQVFPLGEPLYLNRDQEKSMVEQVVGDLKLDGVIIDSLGSTTDDELATETGAKTLMDWNDQLRQRTGAFTAYVHHHRKASSDNKKPNKLADVFGSQYLTARATTVAALWETGVENTLDFIPLKVRLAKKPMKFNVKKDQNLHYTRMVSAVQKPTDPEIVLVEEALEEQESQQESDEGPEKPTVFEL